MNKWMIPCLLLSTLLLNSCQWLTPGPTTAPAEKPVTVVSRAEQEEVLAAQLKILPGAVVTGTLAVAYPGEVLFARGAVLPLPGGVEMLAPLAAVLREGEGLHWQGVVRAESGVSAEYDQALAAKRAELLQRYLRGQGVTEKRLTLTVVPGPGAPLSLALQPAATSAESAAPVKP
jgi:outer membrane protein OmpA-like peptidoglycan-associated protein